MKEANNRILKVPSSETEYKFYFTCPGCDQEHAFNDTIWVFNNDFENPTLSPSYLIRGMRFVSKDANNTGSEPFVCHSFINNGVIQYLGDCTHHLKGMSVELPRIYQ